MASPYRILTFDVVGTLSISSKESSTASTLS